MENLFKLTFKKGHFDLPCPLAMAQQHLMLIGQLSKNASILSKGSLEAWCVFSQAPVKRKVTSLLPGVRKMVTGKHDRTFTRSDPPYKTVAH